MVRKFRARAHGEFAVDASEVRFDGLAGHEEGRGCLRFECPAATFSATRRSAAVSSPVEGYSPVRPASLRARSAQHVCPTRRRRPQPGSARRRPCACSRRGGRPVRARDAASRHLARGVPKAPGQLSTCCPLVPRTPPFRRFLADGAVSAWSGRLCRSHAVFTGKATSGLEPLYTAFRPSESTL